MSKTEQRVSSHQYNVMIDFYCKGLSEGELAVKFKDVERIKSIEKTNMKLLWG